MKLLGKQNIPCSPRRNARHSGSLMLCRHTRDTELLSHQILWRKERFLLEGNLTENVTSPSPAHQRTRSTNSVFVHKTQRETAAEELISV